MQKDNERKTSKNPYPGLFRLAHIVLGISIPILIVTGLGIYSVARPDWSFFKAYPAWLPPMRTGYYHMIFALAFTPAMIIAAISFLRRRGIKKISNSRLAANYLLIISGAVCLLSSIPLLYNNVPNGLYHTSRFLHAVTGLIIIPAVLIMHLYNGLGRAKKLLKHIFSFAGRPELVPAIVLIVVIVLSVVTVTQVPFRKSPANELKGLYIQEDPAGAKELDWDKAEKLELLLDNGHGFDSGRTKMTLRAMFNDKHLFMLAEWEDPSEDRRYWPWIKTATGWERQVDNLDDETVYYEDKFSLLFPMTPNAEFDNLSCSIMCHQSKRMPYGLKIAKKPFDVWHWKSTRTGTMGYIDDKFWLGMDPDDKHAGRHSDPKESGGYTMNLSEDETLPAFLPESMDAIYLHSIPKNKAVPFSEEKSAEFPVGTEIPGIVVERPVGDRGDVRCESIYADGAWHLYIKRELNTCSDRDVVFDERTPFAAAAFDHSAKRHAYNHRVYNLVLEK